MRIFLLLFGSLAVAIALPVQDWVPVESLVEPLGERNPLLGDLFPMQGHVVQEDPKPVVWVKPAELNPVQQNKPAKPKGLVEDLPVVKIMEETKQEGEPVMDELHGQVQAPLNVMVPEMSGEHLSAEEPVLELEPIPRSQEVGQLNPNKLEEEPMIELESEKEETFVENDENFMQKEKSEVGEELGMGLGLGPQETLTEEDRNIMQEEKLLDAVVPPVMELDTIPEPLEVHQRNPNEFMEVPIMKLEPEKEDTFVEDEENGLQEEASEEGEESLMGLDLQETLADINIMQEEELLDAVVPPHQRNPKEFVGEPVMELQHDGTFVEDEDNLMQEEALIEKPEAAEGPAMLKFREHEYHTALNPVLKYEPSPEELLIQYQLQQGKAAEAAESNMMEYLPSEKEFMIADQALMNQNEGEKREGNRWRSCSGVVIMGKCYVYFRGLKKAPDAELFCQNNFRRGHLASVTSRYIHDQMMGLMDRDGGRRRTWIGGLRYLDTGRWLWLDGAHWVYADWLLGEPNNTAGVENCVEILSNGKFNDMPCWDLRAFICSHPF